NNNNNHYSTYEFQYLPILQPIGYLQETSSNPLWFEKLLLLDDHQLSTPHFLLPLDHSAHQLDNVFLRQNEKPRNVGLGQTLRRLRKQRKKGNLSYLVNRRKLERRK
ncbi:hypothetical protein, partial [Bacillus subtilis]|uniref:hypothetical protein n=1 Tax=Bacillus subtilis TaxID=1423 RepID=UPI001BCD2122